MAAKGKKSVSEWETMFQSADKDNNGSLDINELRDLLRQGNCNVKDSQIADTFVYFDGPKGDKKITREEFLNGMKKFEGFYAKLENLFKESDKDSSGFLDRSELSSLLKSKCNFTEAEITEILNDADKNRDGKISFREFLDACT